MIELRDGPGLAIEALPELRIGSERFRQDLDGDRPIEPRVARFVDFSHPARTDLGGDFIWAEPRARTQ